MQIWPDSLIEKDHEVRDGACSSAQTLHSQREEERDTGSRDVYRVSAPLHLCVTSNERTGAAGLADTEKDQKSGAALSAATVDRNSSVWVVQ